ncbi:type II secretion system secretin GspD [Limisalsivibrio acetivorans]|uniref:type II secretion system secretin GspD n=1 Tax=Limisalsivibrio acetivorans TaxID=1304888 RepID=UPI0003B50E07|nr:type II secretion system secretin GspD [Limisalsivibrio acetivorans]
MLTVPAFGQYDVNFNNMTLKDFVQFVAEFTGKNFVYQERDLKGELTIQSGMKMETDDIMEIFYTTLSLNGLAIADKGNFIQIMRNNEAKEYDDGFSEKVSSSQIGVTTTVVPVKNFNVRMLATMLKSLKSREGDAQILNGLNAFILHDTATRVRKILKVVDNLERNAAGYEIHTVEIKNAIASNIDKRLSQLYSELNKNHMTSGDPVIVSDDSSNLMIIAAGPEDFRKISYIIEQMDSPTAGTQNEPRVYYLNNSSAVDIEKVLNKLLDSVVDPKKKEVIKSQVASDKATNSIIAFGDQELYQKIESLIKKLDVPRKQVYVEALILETTLDSGNKFGVEWLAGAGSDSTAGNIGYLDSDGALTGYMGPVLEGKSPSLGALAGGFSLGILGDVITYEGVQFPTLGLLVNAVKSASGINILSNPQILTLDNEEAEIFVGENRPFLTSTKYDSNNNPVQSYDYRDVGVKLKILPHISADDKVTLNIEQEVKKVSASTFDNTAPVTLTRSTKTRVKLKDGATMVISGLIKDDSTATRSAVPGLSKIPLLGWLFKNKGTDFEKTNLMVFISSYIIDTDGEAQKLTEQKKAQQQEFKDQTTEQLKKDY